MEESRMIRRGYDGIRSDDHYPVGTLFLHERPYCYLLVDPYPTTWLTREGRMGWSSSYCTHVDDNFRTFDAWAPAEEDP